MEKCIHGFMIFVKMTSSLMLIPLALARVALFPLGCFWEQRACQLLYGFCDSD